MVFVNAASVRDLNPGDLKGVEISGKEIVLINASGQFHAIGNPCTHMSCMLSDGSLKEDGIHCSCHGSVFDPKTGKVVSGPAKKPEPVYEVKIEKDQVQVNV